MRSIVYKNPYLFAVVYLPVAYRLICEFNWRFRNTELINSTTFLDPHFDNFLPFHSFFIFIYLSYFVFLLTPLFFERKKQFLILFNILIITTFAHICFLLIPTKVERYDLLVHNFGPLENYLLGLIYKYDINSNCFPTLHAGHTLLMSFLYFRLIQDKAVAIFFFIWAVMISLSTIVLHQHSVIDVVAALGFAIITFKYAHYFQKLLSNIFKGKIKALDSNL